MRFTLRRMSARALTLLGLTASGFATAGRAQEVVGDDALTLSEAVALARETHPSLGAARAGEDAATAALGQAKSRWWPQLGGQAGATRYEEPMVVAPIHGFTQEQFERIEFQRTLIQGNASLAWTVFDGGARVNRIRGARAGVSGAAAGRAATEMLLTARVTRAYLEVLTARGVLDAQEQRIGALDAERRRVDQLLTEGQAAQVELLRVDAELAEAEAQQVATRTRLDLAERELARLLGIAPVETRFERLVPVRLSDETPPEERVALSARAKENNPELERSRQNVQAAEASHRVAKAAWIPAVRLGGAYQLFSSEAWNTTTEWNVAVAVSYPLFTGGARSNAVGQAGAEARLAHEELRLAELGIEEGVDRALNASLETRALVSALRRAVQLQAEVARIEQLSLDAGAGTQTDYLRAEAELARARSLLVEAQHAEIAARVELARVVGELTAEWLNSNVETTQ
ncbi:MAG: TolC family protein [Gemmatimonadota bacterium]|nr:MAG: TolC family protein [Gemmatimonadota bacterium]